MITSKVHGFWQVAVVVLTERTVGENCDWKSSATISARPQALKRGLEQDAHAKPATETWEAWWRRRRSEPSCPAPLSGKGKPPSQSLIGSPGDFVP